MKNEVMVFTLICVAILLCGCVSFPSIDITRLWGSSTPTPQPAEPFDAILSNSTIPATMAPGHSYNVSVTIRNTGYSSWSSNGPVMLAPINDPKNDVARFNSSAFYIESDSLVKTGSDYTWNIKMVAPQWNGNYTIEYRMKNGDTYFGDALIQNVTVGDAGSSVEFIPQETVWYPPIGSTSIQRNAWLNVSVTVQNKGRFAWSEADKVWLGTVDYEPNNATLFNPTLLFHIAPFAVVNPGDICTWKFKLHAPPNPGTYMVEYRMKKGDEWFGKSLIVYITVI